MKQKKQKKYYVVTTGVSGNVWERGVAGPWYTKKDVRWYLKATAGMRFGAREVVKVTGV